MQFMQISMLSNFSKYTMMGICLIFSSKSFSQSPQSIEQIGYFLEDAIFYSNKYITPATDAAVYQSSSAWMTSPKKRKLYDVTLSIHGNTFFVPNRDRTFEIKNSDFSFFSIQNSNSEPISSAIVPTTLGGYSGNYFVGSIDGNEIKIKAPKGVDDNEIIYPYFQGSISLWKGFEVMGKFSTKVKLKKSDYQVYGFGIKHNFSQFIKSFVNNKINFATMIALSKEDVSFDFLDVQTPYGSLGINKITGLVDTWQFQVSGSKEWKKFELMFSVISNKSDFKYKLSGERGSIEDVIPVQYIFNEKLKDIYKSKFNTIGEISGRYQFSKIYVQTSFAFGKFVNTNLSLQYEF
jgi:hypothetical protein